MDALRTIIIIVKEIRGFVHPNYLSRISEMSLIPGSSSPGIWFSSNPHKLRFLEAGKSIVLIKLKW